MFFKKFLLKATAALLAAALIFTLPAPLRAGASSFPVSDSAFTSKDGRFDVKISYGYNGFIEANTYEPFSIGISNHGDDFEGSVWLSIPLNNSEVCAYEKKVSIASGSSKTLTFVAQIAAPVTICKVEIKNAKGKTLTEHNFPLNTNNMSDTAKVGILCDDYNALSFLSGSGLKSIPAISLALTRLSETSIPEDHKALSPLSAIILTDYSGDRLSEVQRTAIMNWVIDGGLLIVGTGTGASKVLKGFPELDAIDFDSLRNVETYFGATFTKPQVDIADYMKYEYDYDLCVSTVARSIDPSFFTSEEYLSLIYDDQKGALLYEQYSDLFMDTFWTYYNSDSYSAMLKYYTVSEMEEKRRDFQELCTYNACIDVINFYEKYLRNQGSSPSTNASVTKPVSAMITEIKTGTPVLNGEDLNGGSYVLASYISYGQGTVCAMSVDISKEPFVSSPEFISSITYIIERFSGEQIYNKYMNGGYYYSDNGSDHTSLAKDLSIGDLIPIPIYFLIFAAYAALGFSAYFILKKKKKSIYLWPVQTVLAISTTLLVLAASLITRISRPRVNAVQFTELTENVASINTVAGVILPKNRAYVLNFAKDSNPKLLADYYSYYYNPNSYGNLSNYNIAWLDEQDSRSISLKSDAALSSAFINFSSFDDSGRYSLAINASYEDYELKGTVTNNSELTLENCCILMDFLIYNLGTLTPGQSVDLSRITPYSSISEPYYTNRASIWGLIDGIGETSKNFPHYFLGFRNTEFQREYLKRQTIESLIRDIPGLDDMPLDYYTIRNKYRISFKGSPSREEMCNKLGLNAEGHPSLLTTDPYFICFNSEAPASLLANDHYADENIIEVIYTAIPMTGSN